MVRWAPTDGQPNPQLRTAWQRNTVLKRATDGRREGNALLPVEQTDWRKTRTDDGLRSARSAVLEKLTTAGMKRMHCSGLTFDMSGKRRYSGVCPLDEAVRRLARWYHLKYLRTARIFGSFLSRIWVDIASLLSG